MGERKYLETHEWAEETGNNKVRIGISEHASEEMGDIVYVNFPEVGDAIVAGEICADIESVKAVSDIYSPVSGIVVAVNEVLIDEPGMINEDPLSSWFMEIEEVSKWCDTMDETQYASYVREA